MTSRGNKKREYLKERKKERKKEKGRTKNQKLI
jgi:hypothetical protein